MPVSLRLFVLMACLAGLLTYVLKADVFTGSSGVEAPLNACLSPDRPEVKAVAPEALGPLRDSVVRVLPERFGRLYEEGTIKSANAFSDNSPLAPPVSPTEPRPGGYEMRWWAPSGDDIVADVFLFANGDAARRFFRQAASGRCRLRSHAAATPLPPQARNLTWINPNHAAEADVYLLRGLRVYRIVDVPPNQRRGPSPNTAIARALLTIDTLACLLPGARCTHQRATVPA